MVMADYIDRDRGRRRRRRGVGRRGGDRDRGYYGERDDEDDEDYPPVYPLKILAKPFSERISQNDTVKNDVRDATSPKQYSRFDNGKPIVMLKSNDEPRSKTTNNSVGLANIPNLLANDTMPSHVYKEKKTTQPKSTVKSDGGIQGRLAAPPEMTKSMKLIDENLNWCEGSVSMLLDQTDFLTIGVLGLQGVGKSTIMSILAGNECYDLEKSFVFKPQCKDVRDVCSHQTFGVDMYVTGERAIFLDTQPMLSASILDCMIHRDNKFSADYNTAENNIEIQSLQLASFMMTSCNVVLVVLDWFADLNMLKLIETAEMLKPPTPHMGQDNHHESNTEYYPHVVFVLNGASSEDFNLDNYDIMQCTLEEFFKKSSLKTAGVLNMVSAGLMPRKLGKMAESDINLFLIPKLEVNDKRAGAGGETAKKDSKEAVFSLMTEYRGHHTHEHSTDKLRHSLLAMPRQLITHAVLTEKNWFHYAARSWEGIKKSVLFSEYNRLLP